MKPLICTALLGLAACATTPAALGDTKVKKTVESSKTPAAFATCVAEGLAGQTQIRNDGDHYWVLRIVLDMPRHRWDFLPIPGGSKAELHSTGLAGSGEGVVRGCA